MTVRFSENTVWQRNSTAHLKAILHLLRCCDKSNYRLTLRSPVSNYRPTFRTAQRLRYSQTSDVCMIVVLISRQCGFVLVASTDVAIGAKVHLTVRGPERHITRLETVVTPGKKSRTVRINEPSGSLILPNSELPRKFSRSILLCAVLLGFWLLRSRIM